MKTASKESYTINIYRSERSTPVSFITDKSLWHDRYRVECSIQAKYRSKIKGKTIIEVIQYKRRAKKIRSITIINSLRNATN